MRGLLGSRRVPFHVARRPANWRCIPVSGRERLVIPCPLALYAFRGPNFTGPTPHTPREKKPTPARTSSS
eukprot:6595769-Prymnesium_polylepis.1